MWISTAYAQAAGGDGGGMLVQLMPLLLIFVVFWFFLIRPQQKKAKAHREMVASVRRGDQVVTAGGMFGKVTKVIDESTVQVEIADGVRIKLLSATLSDVLSRGDGPAKTIEKKEPKGEKSGKSDKSDRSDGDDAGGDGDSGEGGEEKKPLFSFGSKK